MSIEAFRPNLREPSSKLTLGFWIYLMTDCVLFATLFATYAVLRNNTAGGEPAAVLFDMPYVLAETVILLMSSFASGLAILAARANNTSRTIVWLIITGFLGASFLAMELNEFAHLATEGNGWTRSGFLSAYFTLVGTHGLHIAIGLLWLAVLLVQIVRKGLLGNGLQRAVLFNMFWHFLEIIWIFIFTIVYLFGALGI